MLDINPRLRYIQSLKGRPVPPRRKTKNKKDTKDTLRPIIDARSIGKIGRCNVPPAGGKLHRLFQSSMPNSSEKIWRCNVPPAGGTLHRLFQSSMPNHRCPIHQKKYGGAMFRRRAAHRTDFSNHRCPIHQVFHETPFFPGSLTSAWLGVRRSAGGPEHSVETAALWERCR